MATKPLALKPGDKIAVTAPAGPPDPYYLDQGVRFLSEAGFTITVMQNTYCVNGYLAGNDSQRVDDFNSCLQDPDIRAIFCARGGYGSPRILSQIDYSALRSDPKIIVGFSDISALLMAVHAETQVVSFHGPMVTAKDCSPWSKDLLLAHVTGNLETPSVWPVPPGYPEPVNRSSSTRTVKGLLKGGCLSMLASLCGTPWQVSGQDSILFIEEIGEAPYRVDRMITQLINAGVFTGCKAVLLGQFENCIQRSDDTEPTPNVWQVLYERLDSLSLPYWVNIAAGHGIENLTLPIGTTIELVGNTIIQSEPGVC